MTEQMELPQESPSGCDWVYTVKVVEAASVAEYLQKYYRRERMTPTILQSYEQDFSKNGFIATGHHDNVLGEFICWPSHEAMAKFYGEG